MLYLSALVQSFTSVYFVIKSRNGMSVKEGLSKII